MKEQNLEALTASPETASSSPPSSSCKLSSSNEHDTQVEETLAAVAKSTTLASTEDLRKNLACQKSEAIEASEDAATEESRNVAKPPDASGKIKLGQPPDIPHSLPESALPTFANTIVMHTFKGTSKGIFRQVSHNGAVVRKFRYNDNSNLWNEWNAIRSVHETKSTCSIVQAIQYSQHGAYEILDTKYIPGESLENTWERLSQESKVKMASDVLATLSEIKSTHTHDKIAASDAKSGFEWNGLLWQKPVSTTDFILDIILLLRPSVACSDDPGLGSTTFEHVGLEDIPYAPRPAPLQPHRRSHLAKTDHYRLGTKRIFPQLVDGCPGHDLPFRHPERVSAHAV